MRKFSIVIAAVILLTSANSVEAHRPIFVEPESNAAREIAAKISNPHVSWAIYAQLSKVGEVNYYTFEGMRGARVKIDLSVPRIESERDFGVAVALIGTGLGDNAAGVPIALNAGEGAIMAPDHLHDPTRIFHEPITQTSYWMRQSLVAQLPQDGTYTIAIWNPRGQTGKYVVAIGDHEQFGLADLLDLPRVWIKVHSFFRDAGTDFEDAFNVLFLGIIVVGAGRWIERRVR